MHNKIKNINQMLLDLNCIAYNYNEEKNLIQKHANSGTFTYGLAELVDIINALEAYNIKYQVNEDVNIQLQAN